MTSKFPSHEELEKTMKIIDKAESARPLSKGADTVDRLKYNICKEILRYKLAHNLTLEDLAEMLETDKTNVSKIINYHIERYTIDKLLRFMIKLVPKFDLSKVA